VLKTLNHALHSISDYRVEGSRSMTWQDIKTAPKDGTVIMLARFDADDDDPEPDAAVAGHWAHWADHHGWYLRGFGVVTDTGVRFDGAGELCDNGWAELRPTHWMPLPERRS
jgi:hypothetical protein